MNRPEFITITPLDREDYRDLIGEVNEDVWPEFMLQDPVADEYWDGLFAEFVEYQYALLDQDGVIAAFANSAPLHWTEPLENLPDNGWDWAMVRSSADHQAGRIPTVLCGLQIAVTPAYQGQGVSRIMLDHMVDVARAHGFPKVIIPVRPSMKSHYPLTPIDRYITWTARRRPALRPVAARACAQWRPHRQALPDGHAHTGYGGGVGRVDGHALSGERRLHCTRRADAGAHRRRA